MTTDMMMKPFASVAVSLLGGVLALGCGGEKGSGKTAGPEIANETSIKLDLPAPPEFKEPPMHSDGTHSVTEVRRRGAKYLDQPIKIKGYVVYKYDCAALLGEKVAREQPDRCDRPHFYLADEQNASHERSIWVVEVPRAPREDEKKVYSKEELAKWPPEPKYAHGDLVVVEGTWATRSPIGFVNSDGLLVYRDMQVVQAATPAPPR